MSQPDATSILLPAARVDFYALDAGTAALGEKLAADWRFARVGIQVNRAGIDAAIAQYGQSAAPELIIVETDDISEAFTLRAGVGSDESPTNDATRTPRLPDNDRMLYSIGMSWAVSDHLSVDAAYQRITIDDPEINLGVHAPADCRP